MTSSSHNSKFTAQSLFRTPLTAEEAELYELCSLAGILMDASVFKIVLDLLHMNVTPMAIEKMLKSMADTQRSASSSRRVSSNTQASEKSSLTSRQVPSISTSSLSSATDKL